MQKQTEREIAFDTQLKTALRYINHLFFASVLDVMEEELFAQFNKIANSILYSKSKEQQNTVESSTRSEEIPGKQCEVNVKRHVPGGISGQNINPIMKIKALQVN